MKSYRSTDVAAEAAWRSISPAFELLEDRLLLSGAAPTFATELPGGYVITPGSSITLGVDGADADNDKLKITAVPWNTFDNKPATSTTLTITATPATDQFAILHFTGVRYVDAQGNVTVGDGYIEAQIFNKEDPTASARFITLATEHVAADGTLSTPVVSDPATSAFYTNVNVHRVIDYFMIQTGDATKGDGTGNSPLPNFGTADGSDMDPTLTFNSPGALAFASSNGPNTSNGQFFITNASSASDTSLNHSASQAGYYIFGQVINGWNVLDAISQVATINGDTDGTVYEPPKLADVQVVTNKQDGVFIFTASSTFTGTTDVKVTLDDGHGNKTEKMIQLTSSTATAAKETATIGSATNVTCLRGNAVTYQPTITNAAANHVWLRVYDREAGVNRATVTLNPTTNLISITVPADYPYAHFMIRILAENQGIDYYNVEPVGQVLDVWVAGATPVIAAPSVTSNTITVFPGATTTFGTTITDDTKLADGTTPVGLTWSIKTYTPAMDGHISIDPTTATVSMDVPADISSSSITAVISAQEDGYTHPRAGTYTFTINTAGTATIITGLPTSVTVAPGTLYNAITIVGKDLDDALPAPPPVDRSGLDYTITSSRTDINASLVDAPAVEGDPIGATRKQIIFTAPTTGSGMFWITVTAEEKGFTDRTPTSQTFYVYTQNAFDPQIDSRVVTSFPQATGSFMYQTADNPPKTMLYVASTGPSANWYESHGLEIFDVTDPAHPVSKGDYTLTDAWNVVVVPRTIGGVSKLVAFVATVTGGVAVLDVSDPASPTLLTTLASNTNGNAVNIYVDAAANRLYQLDWQGGMRIWNITDCGNTVNGTTTTTNITKVDDFTSFSYNTSKGVSQTYTIRYAAAVAVHGNYAYLLDVAGYFFVLDMTTPSSPKFVTAFGTGGRPWDLKLDGNTLYVLDQSTGLIAVSVATPSQPVLLGFRSVENPAWSKLTLAGDLIAVSGSAGYTFIDATDLKNLPTSYSFSAATAGGQASSLNGEIALPLGQDGVVMVNAAKLVDGSLITTNRQFTLANSHKVTVNITGPGDARIHFDGTGNAISEIEIYGTTSASSASITTTGGNVNVTDITITGSLRSLTASTCDLLGDVTATGLVGGLTLHSVPPPTAGSHSLAFNTGGLVVTAKDKLTLNLGSVADASIDTHGEPIAALTVTQWLDTDANDTITAPWIGKLTSSGAGAPVGDFAASLTLSGVGAGTGATLGGASIAGSITGGSWSITGAVGAVSFLASPATWVFDASGGVVSIDATGTGGLDGALSGAYFGRISTKGDLNATIVADASDPTKKTSIGTLSAAVVDDLALNLLGGIGSISVVEWADTGGAAETITAAWIGSLTTTGRKANVSKGLDARAGDFDASLNLTAVGAPENKPILGTVKIAGDLASPTNLFWTVAGDAGAITVGGMINNLTASLTGGDLKSLTAERIQDASLTADALGAVKAWSWEAGSITADTVASLAITGYKGVGSLGTGAVAGNFAAEVTVAGLHALPGKPSMGVSNIAGDVTNSTWLIENGSMAAMTVGGTVQNSNIRSAGSMLGLTMGASAGSSFLAGLSDAGAQKDLADVIASDVAATATINSLTIRGWRVDAGQPAQTFLSGSTFLAGAFGTISLMNSDANAASGLYLLSTAGIKSAKYTDTGDATNNWAWKPTDPSEPPAWTALKNLIPA